MPTSPTLPLPTSAPSPDRPTSQPAAQDKNDNDGFHKALGHARDGATQGDTAVSAHTHTHAKGHRDTRDKDDSSRHDRDDKTDHDAPASTLIPFTPGLELRPIVAAGSGKSLPVKLGTGTSDAAGKGAHGQPPSLLAQLNDAAARNPLNTADGAAQVSADNDVAALKTFTNLALQGNSGARKDAEARTIDTARAGLHALNLPATPTPTPAPAQAQATAAHQLQIPVAPNSPDFTQSLSQHVAWLGAQDIKQAVIHLHPRDLGPLNVNVTVNHNQVDVSFAVQHPGTVHTLQQTLPQLDTLLAQQGLNLGQTHVGQQHNPQQHSGHGNGHAGSSGHSGRGGSAHADAGSDAVIDAPLPARQLAIGLVDDFA